MSYSIRTLICERTYAFLLEQSWTNKIRDIAGLNGKNMRLVKQGKAPVQYLERIRLAILSYAKEGGSEIERKEVSAFCDEILSILKTASTEEYLELINEFEDHLSPKTNKFFTQWKQQISTKLTKS